MEYLNSGFVTILSHYMAYAAYVTLLGKPTSSYTLKWSVPKYVIHGGGLLLNCKKFDRHIAL